MRALALPDAAREQFSTPPLKVMLGQVRFPPILKVAAPGALADFQEEIADEYPLYSEEHQVNLAIGPQGVVPQAESSTHRFKSEDGAWSVVLSTTFVTLEASIATKYSNYDEFRERFEYVWTVALAQLKPSQLVQQGLRYVDHLDWDDVALGEWTRYVNEHLLGVLGVQELRERTVHTLTDARLELDDQVTLALKYGLVRSGPENALGFLLDTDCFKQAATVDVGPEHVSKQFDAFHDEIHVLFHWAFTDEAKERFRGASAGGN